MEALVGAQSSFWSGKRVLLTGHTGFKGSWLALWLERLGAHVVGLSLPPEDEPSLWSALGRPGGERLGNIRDPRVVADAFRAVEPEIVLHLAAQALVHRSFEEPADTFDTNVMGLVRIFDAVRSTPTVRAVVNVTSDKCYENVEHIWPYRETERVGGSDPYSASKGCAELVTTSYRKSFFNDATGPLIASARAGNVIGGGDWSRDRLLPDCVRAWRDDKEVLLRNPLAVRPWQHVLEPLSGYLLLAEALVERGPEFAAAWNFGPRDIDVWSVGRVVDRFAALWGDGASWRLDAHAWPKEAMLLRVDATKAHAKMGWTPRFSIDEALEMTMEWYKAASNGEDMRAFTIRQIAVHQGEGT